MQDDDTLSADGAIWRQTSTFLHAGVIQTVWDSQWWGNFLSRQIRVSAEYLQGLANTPQINTVPQISIGAENDMLFGLMSTGYRLHIGGTKRLASSLELRLMDRKRISLRAHYDAYGSPFLSPRRGVGAGLRFGFYGLQL
ncbi:hypothetical protein [Chitinivibrio alkaliphilus]|uniref:Uncharacterized protein n=1 Tax=Chitinivibrio alkaliphilus ACht1 TaxID=1313304 RepID=U7D4I3_9BACT|nr:hypothetical protein [Chitinivibrio alkaliphilus]ERP30838.1 hypothetical protein CALK_2328 [Chitinivibrio alkaliphilus ACht1]